MDIYEETTAFYAGVKTEKRIIGKSEFGRNIYAVKIGDGNPVGLAQYAMHGREFITAKLAFSHYEIPLFKGSFWLLPLVNPDGALLSQKGIESVENKRAKKRLIAINKGEDFSLWKANGRGVDLNVNFPAKWGAGEKNIRYPSGENYIGKTPFSERETKALKAFTEEIKPNYTISYHTKGEEIYWYFDQDERERLRDFALAKVLSKSTGYAIGNAKGSVGGYKDWCIQRFHIPAFTVETGKDSLSHPIGENGLKDIIAKNEKSLYDLSKEYIRLL